MARHPTLYFTDGSLTLKASDGTLYNVYRQQLMTLSDCFNGMLTLPIPDRPCATVKDSGKDWVESGRKAGLDGFEDDTAVELPTHFTAMECEKFLEFIFNTKGWSPNVPKIEDLCAILKTSHFFGADTGIEYALFHLQDHKDLGAALRFSLGCNYHHKSWMAEAFDELMTIPITDFTPEDEALIGWQAYRALAIAQAKVSDHRTTLAVFPPEANHANSCNTRAYCTKEWEKAWTSESGVLGALLKEELPGSEIHDKLETYSVGGLNAECHERTCRLNVKETPERKSSLKREEEIIDEALKGLLKRLG
ncbi:hypothetical protein B0H11DRAFT_2250519 [Mycena galericulata]|nr:hypothetical protein B0H11DRAFT_2250519 [Mycena galericulata]